MLVDLLLPAFFIGLMGAGHCLGMCGGISAAFAFALADGPRLAGKVVMLGAYNLGRIASYVLIGLLAGAVGRVVQPLDAQVGFPLLRTVAALMLILMGLYVGGWWRVLARLEQLGAGLWRALQPLAARLLPVKTPWQALLAGGVWGWLPCGLVYSALVLALAQGEVLSASLVMLSFGLGTLPALLIGGVAGEGLRSVLRQPALRSLMGLSLIGFGLWTAYFAALHSSIHGHHHAAVYTDKHQHQH